MIKQPFYPKYGSGQLITTSAVSATATIQPGNKQIALTNTGTVIVYVRVTPTTTTTAATTADFPLMPGFQVVNTINETDGLLVSHISPAGAGQFHLITGEGY